jgi:hypothetical protein
MLDVTVRNVTLVHAKLEIDATFKFVPKIEAALMVVTFVVERLEFPVTLRVVVVVFVDTYRFPVTWRFAPRSELEPIETFAIVYIAGEDPTLLHWEDVPPPPVIVIFEADVTRPY